MLKSITGMFTTAAPVGVTIRDVVMTIGTILALLGTLGILTAEQVTQLRHLVDEISGQVPALVAAGGVVITAGVSIYRIITKSSSDKAAEAAKRIDAELPAEAAVRIQTPGTAPDIFVAAK